jgi:hypothetical protein
MSNLDVASVRFIEPLAVESEPESRPELEPESEPESDAGKTENSNVDEDGLDGGEGDGDTIELTLF